MQLKVTFNDWAYAVEKTDVIKVEDKVITSISCSYDGGRFHIHVNKNEVFASMEASHDVSVEIEIGDD
jgi:hypothetical protein